MGKVADVLKGLPGIIPEDAYDDDYPDGVAGHVSAGARIDTSEDAVRTPFGIDHAFSGEDIDRDTGHRPQEVGEQRNDERVREAVDKANKANKQYSNVANEGRYGNHVFPTPPAAVRLVRRNANRKQVSLMCVSGGPCFVGSSTNIQATPSPDTAYLPNGLPRIITHKDDVVVIGPANAIVDFIEEVY